MQEKLHDLNEYAMHNNNIVCEQINIIQYYLTSFAQTQNYSFAEEFCNAVEDLNEWTK